MNPEQIRSGKQAIIARYGPWTAHSIRLADGVDTFEQPHWDTRLYRFVQIASDLSRKPLKDLRVLDLACLEGQFAIEFALQGARVVATEGRPANLWRRHDLLRRLSGLTTLNWSSMTCATSASTGTVPLTWCCAWESSTISTPRTLWDSSGESQASARAW